MERWFLRAGKSQLLSLHAMLLRQRHPEGPATVRIPGSRIGDLCPSACSALGYLEVAEEEQWGDGVQNGPKASV